jgi:hypothetical protein
MEGNMAFIGFAQLDTNNIFFGFHLLTIRLFKVGVFYGQNKQHFFLQKWLNNCNTT